MIDKNRIAWLAGLLEGEGSFLCTKHHNGVSVWMRIDLVTTDKDTAERAAELMECANVNGPYFRPGRKPHFSVRACGYRANRIMQLILPYMGIRRKLQIDTALAMWNGRASKKREHRLAAICHPDRPQHSGGLCRSCYEKDVRARRAA